MKHIPKIFPISLLFIVVFMFFLGAYAVAENAVGEALVVETVSAYTAEGREETTDALFDSQVDWYEQAAVWVCPLH